jgi:DNA-binding winged helix-turn-helix (wHTH) protein/TolB-like protein
VPPVRFGKFGFDPATRELKRDGLPVRLQAQPAQVLTVLIERAGRTVTREDLCQAVWGNETHVDFDQGLNYCIAQIRTALGDSADSPCFVRTIPKRGYQFIAPIVPVSSVEPQPPPSARLRRSFPIWVVAATLLFATGAVIAVVYAQHRAPINIAVVRFDNETGIAEMNTFSDAVTDQVVAQLAADSGNRFGIIGNAAILRQPRSQRDLLAIGSALNAGYVILGQVQRDSGRFRVLAHLIRLPDQTHVAVARFDRDIGDELQTETELSRLIASQFLRRLPASHSSLFR